MAPGLPARVVIVCAVFATAATARAQGPARVPADRPPVTSPVALPPPAAAPAAQPPIAQPSGRRQVAVIDLASGAGEQLADQLYNALVNHVDLRPLASLNLAKALKGPIIDEELRFITDAKAARDQAADALVQLDHRTAEVAADRGMQALHNVRPTSEVLGLYAELAFASGQAALKLRKPNDASLSFGLSYRLDPGKRPDPARYEPDIVEAYQLAVTKIPVPAKLEIQGTGTVWIDGVDRGPPGTFDVSHGRHLVQLTGPERETRGTQVTSPADAAIAIEPAPASDERKVERLRVELAHARDDAARAGSVKKLAKLLGVGDAVLIEKTESGALRVQTWSDRESGFSAWVEHGSEPPSELLVPLAPPRKPEPPKLPEVPPETPIVVETPLYKRRWFQGAVATAILAAATTIYLFATQERMQQWDRDIKPEGN